MKKFLGPALAGLLLVGCAPSGPTWTGPTWKAVNTVDEFTDKVTTMATVSEYAGGSLVVTKSLKYYPFVGIQNGEPYVGIRSGGRYKIPTGTVQLRIDSNPAWTISPEETPIALAPSIPTMNFKVENQALDMAAIQKQALATATKMMSPYTVATGDKARSILREMLHGKILKYRTVGMNQAASTTGEVTLDASFVAAIRRIGIDPAGL